MWLAPLILILALAGCVSSRNPCSMDSMSSAQLSKALVEGCRQ